MPVTIDAEAEVITDDARDDDEIISIINAELSVSDSSYSGENDNEDAYKYYNGDPRGDEIEGRSQIVSTDVADAIEWILPQVIKAMVSKGSVVTFDPLGPEDEDQADLETEFVHDVFMKENEGFLNLYEFVKDALLTRNGVFKIYYDNYDHVQTERYTGLNEMEFQVLLAQPNVQPVEIKASVDEAAAMQQSMQQQQQAPQGMQPMTPAEPPMMYDVAIEVKETKGRVKVDCINPDDFRVNSDHTSLDLSDARFTAHLMTKTRSDLIEEGYDPELVMELPTSSTSDSANTYRSDSWLETENYTEDPSQEEIEISECIIRMDKDGRGVASLHKVTAVGHTTVSHILDVELVSDVPFVSTTAIIMSHKYQGKSIYDRLKQLQDQKTSLWRNILDNLYLQNNREKEVLEGQVNIDDLLVSRPGGVKRVKQMGAIRELEVQPIGQEGYQMLGYLDQVRTGRVGVSPETAGVDLDWGESVGSNGVDRIMTAKEELTGLMIRTIAETGLKKAYLKIRDLLVRNQDSITKFKYKGQWKPVNPSEWGVRSRMSVQVGTGTGDDRMKITALNQVLAYQEKILMNPQQTLVDEPQIYNALDELARVSGLVGADKYFNDPSHPEARQKKQQKQQQQQQDEQRKKQLEQMAVEAQLKLGEAEQMKGQAALQAQQAKIMTEQAKLQAQQIENEKNAQIEALKLQLDKIKQDLAEAEASAKLEFEYEKLRTEEALKLTEMEVAAQRDLSRQEQDNKEGKTDDGQEGGRSGVEGGDEAGGRGTPA